MNQRDSRTNNVVIKFPSTPEGYYNRREFFARFGEQIRLLQKKAKDAGCAPLVLQPTERLVYLRDQTDKPIACLATRINRAQGKVWVGFSAVNSGSKDTFDRRVGRELAIRRLNYEPTIFSVSTLYGDLIPFMLRYIVMSALAGDIWLNTTARTAEGSSQLFIARPKVRRAAHKWLADRGLHDLDLKVFSTIEEEINFFTQCKQQWSGKVAAAQKASRQASQDSNLSVKNVDVQGGMNN